MLKNLKILILLFLLLCESTLAKQDNVLINEDFSNNKNDWEIFNDKISSTNIQNGIYIVENRTVNPTEITKIFNLTAKENFEIKITTGYIYGRSNDYYGLLFGENDINNGYFFGISKAKNKYVIYRTYNGKKLFIRKPTKCKLLKTNKLKIKKIDNQVYFLINGEICKTIVIDNFYGKNIGFFVGNKQSVTFDNFIVKKLDKKSIKFNNYATLTLNVPDNSKIKILNIQDVYKDSMLLKKGKYHILITKKGYNSYDKWITLSDNTTLNLHLSKYKAPKTIVLSNGNIVWENSRNPHPFKNVEKIGGTIWEKRSEQNIYDSNWNQAKKYCKNLKLESDGFIIDNFKLPSLTQSKTRYKIQGSKGITQCSLWSSQRPYTFEFCSWGKGAKRYTDANRRNPVLCVSSGHFVFNNKLSVITLANKLMKASYENTKKILLPKKPQKIKNKKIKKDEFETTKQYTKRIAESHKRVDQQNSINLKQWENDIKNLKQKSQDTLNKFKQKKSIVYLEYLQKAMHLKYGSPKISEAHYNADNETFTITIKSTHNQYNNKIQLPVKIQYAKKFKTLIMDKNFHPTITLNLTNNHLTLKSIKEINNPKLLVEQSEFTKACKNNKSNSIISLQEFIKQYPDSSLIPSAKNKVKDLKEQIKIRKEKERLEREQRAIENEVRRKRIAAEKQRKNDSFYSKKYIGEKVCMDGSMAIVLSITITAYVENVNGNNIQLRIADTEGTTPYVKGVSLYKNTLIWDDYTNWYKCDY